MRKLLTILAIAGAGIFFASFGTVKHNSNVAIGPVDSLAIERKKIIRGILDSLQGKEKMPADSIFKNLQLFSGQNRLQVNHLMGVMNYWGEALGVSCKYCHSIPDWAADDKPTKKVARDMYALRQKN